MSKRMNVMVYLLFKRCISIVAFSISIVLKLRSSMVIPPRFVRQPISSWWDTRVPWYRIHPPVLDILYMSSIFGTQSRAPSPSSIWTCGTGGWRIARVVDAADRPLPWPPRFPNAGSGRKSGILWCYTLWIANRCSQHIGWGNRRTWGTPPLLWVFSLFLFKPRCFFSWSD